MLGKRSTGWRDLFVTNTERLSQGIKKRWANPFDQSTISFPTETLDTIEIAKRGAIPAISNLRVPKTYTWLI
jgi:enolase